MDFEVQRQDLHTCRTVNAPPVGLEPGQVRLRIDAFGLTSNNITYGVFGEMMQYWAFYPAEDGWGRIPAWGYGNVVDSRHDDVATGLRLYGFVPMSTDVVLSPGAVDERGFVDVAPHRKDLAAVYNTYRDVASDPTYDPAYEAHEMVLRPLLATSFLLDDFVADNDVWGTKTVLLSSASSKTALGTAFLLSRRPDLTVVGLTSPGNADFVAGLGYYDKTVTYDAITDLPIEPAVYLDFSGNDNVRTTVHTHYGDALAFSSLIGATHWDKTTMAAQAPGPTPTLFFAPEQGRKRVEEWGQDGFDKRLAGVWKVFIDASDSWFEVMRHSGPDAVERVYREVLDGRSAPSVGHVVSLWDAQKQQQAEPTDT